MDGQDPGARPRNWINFQFPFLAAAGRAIPGANLNAEVKLSKVDQSGEWRAAAIGSAAKTYGYSEPAISVLQVTFL